MHVLISCLNVYLSVFWNRCCFSTIIHKPSEEKKFKSVRRPLKRRLLIVIIFQCSWKVFCLHTFKWELNLVHIGAKNCSIGESDEKGSQRCICTHLMMIASVIFITVIMAITCNIRNIYFMAVISYRYKINYFTLQISRCILKNITKNNMIKIGIITIVERCDLREHPFCVQMRHFHSIGSEKNLMKWKLQIVAKK